MRRDPGEEYDVIKLYPEIAKELEDLAEIARKDMGDNPYWRKRIKYKRILKTMKKYLIISLSIFVM